MTDRLTDAEIVALVDPKSLVHYSAFNDGYLEMKVTPIPFARAIEAAVLARTAPVPPDAAGVRERERKAFAKGWDEALQRATDLGLIQKPILTGHYFGPPGAKTCFVLAGVSGSEVARERYPAPTPPTPPSVTLSDGSVVTWERMSSYAGGVRMQRTPAPTDQYRGTHSIEAWRNLLSEPTDTGADFDAVKALAASVAREGR